MSEHASRNEVGPGIGACIEAACVMEVLAPKVGNVSPGMAWNFADLGVADFLASASAIRPVFEKAADKTVGELVAEAVCATRAVVSTNTNLGQILLLAPLAKAAAHAGCIDPVKVMGIVRATTVEDAVEAYSAIARAQPGGMGRRDHQDLSGRPTCTLLEAMTLASGHDDVAAQYAGGFAAVFEIAGNLCRSFRFTGDWRRAIADVHLGRLVSGDTLIRRKCGEGVETEMKSRAAAVLGLRDDADGYQLALTDLDDWLRADGNKRNPGTTADLITAGLFVGLFTGGFGIPHNLAQLAAGSEQ